MAKNYLFHGDKLNVPPNTLTSAVTSGELVTVGAVRGVALNDGAANEVNTVQLEGVFDLAKATGAGTGGNIGDKANVDGSNLITGGAGTLVGIFWATAADGDDKARVKLLGNSVS